jgi:hypothetical protein
VAVPPLCRLQVSSRLSISVYQPKTSTGADWHIPSTLRPRSFTACPEAETRPREGAFSSSGCAAFSLARRCSRSLYRRKCSRRLHEKEALTCALRSPLGYAGPVSIMAAPGARLCRRFEGKRCPLRPTTDRSTMLSDAPRHAGVTYAAAFATFPRSFRRSVNAPVPELITADASDSGDLPLCAFREWTEGPCKARWPGRGRANGSLSVAKSG